MKLHNGLSYFLDSLLLMPQLLAQEPQENGPLFSELAFYQRVAKEEKSKNCIVMITHFKFNSSVTS